MGTATSISVTSMPSICSSRWPEGSSPLVLDPTMSMKFSRTAAAVPALARALEDEDEGVRLASVQALAEIASPGALQNLERGVDDASRDVRIASSRALAATAYRPAFARVDAAVRGGAEAVTLVNTVMGMAIDPATRTYRLGNGGGGLSGAAIHPVAVRAVHDVAAARPHVPIVGVGGVTDATTEGGRDAVNM